MPSSNKTPQYGLPQFLPNDVPTWLDDINPAMATIDSGIAAAKTTAEDAIALSDEAQNAAATALNSANEAKTAAGNAQTAADEAKAAAEQAGVGPCVVYTIAAIPQKSRVSSLLTNQAYAYSNKAGIYISFMRISADVAFAEFEEVASPSGISSIFRIAATLANGNLLNLPEYNPDDNRTYRRANVHKFNLAGTNLFSSTYPALILVHGNNTVICCDANITVAGGLVMFNTFITAN